MMPTKNDRAAQTTLPGIGRALCQVDVTACSPALTHGRTRSPEALQDMILEGQGTSANNLFFSPLAAN